MTLAKNDLGVLGNLAVALGIFTPQGDPNPSWFGSPETSLKEMLANAEQRAALIAFVDEAMGGADRTSDPRGVIWLPLVHLDDPDLTLAITVDESAADGLHIGLGVAVRTSDPVSESTLAVPLFRAHKDGGPSVSEPLLLGSSGGRIRLSTEITIDASAPAPGSARLGAIGVEVDLPTAPDDPVAPVFGLSLRGFQLPGASAPRDIRVAADGVDELDDALLDLVLSLVKSQADAAAPGSPIAVIGGLLGLRNGDSIPDFPIEALASQGVHAIAAWLHDLITVSASRNDWLGYLAGLLGGARNGDVVQFALGGGAQLSLGLRVETGPTNNTLLTPTLAIQLGGDAARVEASADLFRIDLVGGAATALPRFGVWAAAGRPVDGQRVLDLTAPTVARADVLRLGFALDAQLKLTFVLAADGVLLGTHPYATLDLTSPDAVMDAVGQVVGGTVDDIANQLLGNLGAALPVARTLLGLAPPAGVPAVTLAALLSDPVAAVGSYWRALLAAAPGAFTSVLSALKDALVDASEAVSIVSGDGSALDPWRVPLVSNGSGGSLALEFARDGTTLAVHVAAATTVDTLGQRCTVLDTRLAATLARIDLSAMRASLLPGVEATLSARERGVSPPRVTLGFGDGVVLRASGVGLRLAWAPNSGLAASVDAPDLRLDASGTVLPIALPVIAPDGSVTLPPEAWDGVEALVGYLGELGGGVLGDITAALGWAAPSLQAGGLPETAARLRLAELIANPASALAAWLPELALSDLGPRALALLADLFHGAGANRGVLRGTGHPDDPYRFALADGLPNLALWFPPQGLEPRLVAASDALQRWRPGDPGLAPTALAAGLRAEASVSAELRALTDGRDLAGGLAALAQRWIGGDGRIVPPSASPPGVTLVRSGLAAGQLLDQLDLEDLTGRVPTTTVYIALGASAWPDAPAGRRVDLCAASLTASMFAVPSAAVGDWFVALGSRADCLLTDGTPEQAARLARVLDAIATVSNDIAIVALAGAGHAARLAAQAQPAVTDLVLLGTPLGVIALTAISTQPTADALRLLNRLLPAAPADDPDAEPEDSDLALGRGLVGAMMELVDRADPSADLRVPALPPDVPRAGLAVTAVIGAVTAAQVDRAITAIVAAGLAGRARDRAQPLPPASGVQAGLRYVLAPTSTGALAIDGSAALALFGYDRTSGPSATRALRVQLAIGDRLGWLSAAPELELRRVSVDVTIPLDGSGHGAATLTLHDARVGATSWERLVLGTGADAVPVLPEARILLAAAVQRITADAAGTASVALAQLLTALGIVAPGGGVAADAVDQLIHDPGGLIRARLAAAQAAITSAVAALLGAPGAAIDLAARSVRVQGGDDGSGRFGWHADMLASPTGLGGQVRIGPSVPVAPTGALNLVLQLSPFNLALQWHQSGGATDVVALWPAPDAMAMARALAKAAPSLGGHAALELLRRADESARPIVDALLDAFGLLRGVAGDAERALRPLAGLIADPAGWLRSSASLAASPARIQALFDALRPMLGVVGNAGEPIALASGVTLAVTSAGGGARLALAVDPSVWATPGGATARLSGGLAATLDVGLAGPPQLGLDLNAGLTGAAAGRRALHARIGASGLELFLRPATGADISLVPFAGLGSLAQAAEAALPFLLDKLAAIPGNVGDLVGTVGDALGLRSGNPKQFNGEALHAWGVDPAGALASAIPTITATGLAAIRPLLAGFVPAGVAVSATGNTLTIAIGALSATWSPASGVVRVVGDNVAVPGIERLSFALALAAGGLDEIRATVGPAAIDAGGVMLRPLVTVAAGANPLGGRRIAVGMAVDDQHRFAARWLFDTQQFALTASDGPLVTAVETVDPVQVALRVVEVVADLVAGVAMAQQPVRDLLDTTIGTALGSTVRKLMAGVVLTDPTPNALIAGLFDPSTLLDRIGRLFRNIADAAIAIDVGGFTITFAKEGGSVGLKLGLTQRYPLVNDDVMLWLENDGSWIDPPRSGGVFAGIVSDSGAFQFKPSLVVDGVGLRIGKSSGPLLDIGLTLESIALLAYAEIGAGPPSGGVQLQFSNLAVPTGGAQGDNGIAQGVMRDTGPTPPQPMFSPALAIQKHGSNPVQVSLRAGDGNGPWWIAIQKGFGPLYLEQVGFGATTPQGKLERISLLMDGSVSMFGLTCAVDDLQITYFVSKGDFFKAENWAVDLAGLAVSADMAGVSIAGGLLKQTTDQGIEYLGMLLGRFAVYGITIYGGYGEGVQDGQKFTAFFAVGAVNGPIGGPPAFFLTGIGGGFGINRKLIVPTDLSRFGDYPLIQALDIAAKPQKPMDQLRALGAFFPMRKGTFWFAAGLSFNSFALVDGIAVVAVEIGDGLDINLLGLARMALPRPQVALVSIELALLVRFSSSEGVLWVQGQLTDNSWLLYPDIKLTGGFAYVLWFKGEHKGEFVLTLGGYHPDFHRDGYPVVPRLGMRWSIGDAIVIKSGSYFALTSEALMAGGDFEASAHFGPAWAEVKFGAHGIVYFDPFHYHVYAYARIAAGVTIDTWLFGEVTFSINIGARIDVTGPDFHGKAEFDVGPIGLTVEFGGSDKAQVQPLAADAFITKYLAPADGGGGAQAHAVMTAAGAQPSKGKDSTPDGSSVRPFVVVAEFALTFTSTVPAVTVTRVQAATTPTTTHAASGALGVAPMIVSDVLPTITLTWLRGGVARTFPFVATPRPYGAFPAGIWGLPGDPNNRKVPKGDMIEALNELDLVSRAAESPGGPEIPYYQVEIAKDAQGRTKRKPLPFSRTASDVAALKTQANAVSALVAEPASVKAAFKNATTFLAARATPTGLASLRGERQSPPLLGTLTEGLESPTATVVPGITPTPPGKTYDHFIDAPIAVGLTSGATAGLRVASPARTTVKDSARAWRVARPTLAKVEATHSRSIAVRLVLVDPPAVATARAGRIGTAAAGGTLIGALDVPPSAAAHAAPVLVARSGSGAGDALAAFGDALASRQRAVPRGTPGATLTAAQTVVLKMPNARADAALDVDRPSLAIGGAPARVVLLGHGGVVRADRLVGPDAAGAARVGSIEIGRGTERIVAIGQGAIGGSAADAGLSGWHAGLQMHYAGWSTAVAPGCVVRAAGGPLRLHRERVDAGWVSGAELARGVSTVTTTFTQAPRVVVVVLDDPAAFGDPTGSRQLLLGLDGADRVRDGAGVEMPPALLTMENRNVLAYDIVPDGGDRPVVVSIASEAGWSLVGVMGSALLDAAGAVSLISARGLDAALHPIAAVADAALVSTLVWKGPVRASDERMRAQALARGRPPPAASAPAKQRRKAGRR